MQQLFQSAVSLRLPQECPDFGRQLRQLLLQSGVVDYAGLQQDVDRLTRLRHQCVEACFAYCTSPQGQAAEVLFQQQQPEQHRLHLQEYAAALQQLIDKSLDSATTNNNNNALQLYWKAGAGEGASQPQWELCSSLRMERAHVVFNLAALEAHEAQWIVRQQPSSSSLSTSPQQQQSWNRAVGHLQLSAATARHLQSQVTAATVPETRIQQLSIPFLQFWECLLLAEAQRAAYECFACMPRPNHFMLAKLAAAAFCLYRQCDNNNENNLSLSLLLPVRAYSMYWSSLAEYHQAMVCRDKKDKQEFARLEAAMRYATVCQEHCCTRPSSSSSSACDLIIAALLEKIEAVSLQIQTALTSADPAAQTAIIVELSEIRPKQTVKLTPNDVSRVLPALAVPLHVMTATVTKTTTTTSTTPRNTLSAAPPPTLSSTPSSSFTFPAATSTNTTTVVTTSVIPADATTRRYAQAFLQDMDRRLEEAKAAAQEKTEAARQTLATVHLPHSLAAYRQQQQGGGGGGDSSSGGGIPAALWERVQAVQQQGQQEQQQHSNKTQQQLWELRDAAETARQTYKQIQDNLQEDLQMDVFFRQQNPDFAGHDVEQVQRSYRQALANYDRLMAAAQASDVLLLEKSQVVETDPKFRLLQFRKAQLDSLLTPKSTNTSGASSGSLNNNNDSTSVPEIDVSALSKYLVDLSALFDKRDNLLHQLQQAIKTYNIANVLSQIAGDNNGSSTAVEHAYRQAVDKAKRSFDGMFEQIHAFADEQKRLLVLILKENELFMNAKEESSHRSNIMDGNSCSIIAKMEDALNEMEQFSKHLQEGRAFYDVIIPKLEKLLHQVGDVSARLTVGRCEHEDQCRRSRQEAEDARMAANLAEDDGGGGGSSNHSTSYQDHSEDGFSGHNDGNPASSSNDGIRNSNSHNRMFRDASGGSGHGGGGTPGGRVLAVPGVEQVSHDVPAVRVDDEKVASLVGMDFDPERVVEALRKYDNDMDQALNDLLMG